ncbi:MAG: restriction endonuclease subunit S [Cyanobacteria bacterium P01_D01_bin.156]
MGGYLAYTEYRDSGVEWLGDIPSRWKAIRLAFLTDKIGDGIHATPKYVEKSSYHFINGNNLVNGRIYIDESTKCVGKNEFDVYNLKLSQNTLLLSINGTIGNVAYYNNESVVLGKSAAYISCKVVLSRFFLYFFLNSSSARNYFFFEVTGTTIFNLSLKSLKNLFIPLPTLAEQQQIAAFLDYKTAQIDALIAKKEALLEKLAEKRTALISQAVTKGLDPTVPMKDSGIEWLDEIPEHWEIKRQRFLFEMTGGSTPSKNNPDFWDGDIPWVSPKDMKRPRLDGSIDRLSQEALEQTSIHLHSSGKVLIVVRGMILAHTFPVAVNDVQVTVNQDMKVLDTTLNPEYLAILLRGISSLVLSIVEESAHGTKVLRTDLFKNIFIPVPPFLEQENIVKYVKDVTDETDKMIGFITAAVKRLKEYRTALVTNAVTGKIDVRDIKLPGTKPVTVN